MENNNQKLNVYAKLQLARVKLQSTKLNKSGNNKFAGYKYFELGDFLPAINSIFNDLGLASVVNFNSEIATLTVINTDKPDEQIVFTSPMSNAQLKGCHEVQNLGAVQTYIRRYLYVNCMEIVEHDALDSTNGSDKNTAQAETTATLHVEKPSQAQLKMLSDIAGKKNTTSAKLLEDINKAYQKNFKLESLTKAECSSILKVLTGK